MLGAIFGDIVGSVYEFHNTDDYAFRLLSSRSKPTDDSYMTLAVAESLMETWDKPDDDVREAVVRNMRRYGREYPDGGYGGMFSRWLQVKNPKPYNSFGNGSAMRVSPAGWLYETMEETLHAAELTAEVTHNHPEGIKGAQAIAAATYLARTGTAKADIRSFIEQNFGYDLSRSWETIRKDYGFYAVCQKSVPEALCMFLQGKDYEDVIRLSVSLGGDSDTIACMAGAVAEAYFGMPEWMKEECMKRLDPSLQKTVIAFRDFCHRDRAVK